MMKKASQKCNTIVRSQRVVKEYYKNSDEILKKYHKKIKKWCKNNKVLQT
jgi:hypothetical protein